MHIDPMHIGLDASRATMAHRTGTESYALHLTRALLANPRGHAFTLYFRDKPAPDLFSSGRQRLIPFRRLWTHVRLSWELLTRPRPDVLFIPAHTLPIIHPLPSVVTLHDVGYRYFPDAHPFPQRWYLEWSTRFAARAATHLIADSHATARDTQKFYGIPANKITVIYPGRDESLQHVDPAPIRAKYQLPEKYILHVGTLQPRKNLARLMEAWQAVSDSVALVLVGRAGWLSAPIVAQAQACGARLLDYVSDEDLPALYSGATVFAFPSLYEGFGFPVLEAMACGVPVICSNTSSLPEVAGEAALTVNPLDTRTLAEALQQLLADSNLRAALVAKGYAQIQKFSWAKAAQETLDVLEKTVTGNW